MLFQAVLLSETKDPEDQSITTTVRILSGTNLDAPEALLSRKARTTGDQPTRYHQQMHRVHLLTTGGTIEKRYVEQAGSMENTVPQIRRCLALLRLPDAEITVEELMNLDSLVMTDDHRRQIASRVLAQAVGGIPVLVTHGTDTMVETGKIVAATLAAHPGAGNVPVIFTGAMTPFGIEDSDAIQNLTEALLCTRLLPGGVFLAFHGEVFPIDRVRKDREKSRFVLMDSSSAGTENTQ